MSNTSNNRLGRLIHDLSYIIGSMNHSNQLLRESLNRNEIFDSKVELYINESNTLIDKVGFLLNIYRILEEIERSGIHPDFKVQIDLLSRLIERENDIKCSNHVLWSIGFEESDLLQNYINADRNYLTAINCILDNAVKYAYSGSIINIKFYSDKLVISNLGIPILEDEMSHIYDYEYRGSAAKARDCYGMGYGLFIAKKVLDAYESTISITSEPIHERNKEVETILVHLINMHDSINKYEYKRGVKQAITDIEFDAAKKAIEQICNIYDISYDSKYHYVNKSSVWKWLRYWSREKSNFTKEKVDEDAIIFFQPISKTTVTINYGKEKENSNNR